jgi:uncharacterized protein YoxC
MDAIVRHIHTHKFDDAAVRELLASIRNLAETYQALRKNQEAIMTKLDDIIAKSNQVLADVRAETEVDEAIKAVVEHQNETLAAVNQQLKDAIDQNDPTKLQGLSDIIDQIQQTNMANAQKVADAVKAGTPVDTGSAGSAPSTGGATQGSADNPAPAPATPLPDAPTFTTDTPSSGT